MAYPFIWPLKRTAFAAVEPPSMPAVKETREKSNYKPEAISYLTWRQIKEMAAYGIEFQSHTNRGYDFIDGKAPLSRWTEAEILEDIRSLEQLMLKHGVTVPIAIAYPWGVFNERTSAAWSTAAINWGLGSSAVM